MDKREMRRRESNSNHQGHFNKSYPKLDTPPLGT